MCLTKKQTNRNSQRNHKRKQLPMGGIKRSRRAFKNCYLTFWSVDEDLHVFEDPQAEELLPGHVRPLHHLEPPQNDGDEALKQMFKSVKVISFGPATVTLYVHRWDSWRGRRQRSRSRAGPPWFSQVPECWRAGRPPANTRDQQHFSPPSNFATADSGSVLGLATIFSQKKRILVIKQIISKNKVTIKLYQKILKTKKQKKK